MAAAEPESGPATPGLLASLRNLAANAVGILRTRLALLGAELEEESLRLAQLALWAVVALLCLTLGMVMFSLFVVLMFWDTHRVAAVLLLMFFYIGAAIVIGLWVRSCLSAGSRLFSASLAELAKDREKLTTRNVA